MLEQTRRGSDRVTLALPIELIGMDALGAQFFQEGRTVVLSRCGATILLNRKLAPDQLITVRLLTNNKETEARIVGMIGRESNEFIYGITLLDSPDDFWGVAFPPLSPNDDSVARVLLKCGACSRRDIVHLNEVELQVLEATGNIIRHCNLCATSTQWSTESADTGAPFPVRESVEAGKAATEREEAKRKYDRVPTKFTACVRQLGASHNIVVCEDISRGGLRFLSRIRYDKETRMEIAVPYSPNGGGNIFVPIRIVHVRPYGDLFRHGAAYVKGKFC